MTGLAWAGLAAAVGAFLLASDADAESAPAPPKPTGAVRPPHQTTPAEPTEKAADITLAANRWYHVQAHVIPKVRPDQEAELLGMLTDAGTEHAKLLDGGDRTKLDYYIRPKRPLLLHLHQTTTGKKYNVTFDFVEVAPSRLTVKAEGDAWA